MTALDYPFELSGPLGISSLHTTLREERGLARIRMTYGGEAWLATRHADVAQVLSDPRFSRAAAAGRDAPRARPMFEPPELIFTMDAPGHTRLRKLVSQAFTSRRIEQLRPRVRELTGVLVDDLIAAGPPADLTEKLAWQLPVSIMCELLGVPTADRNTFRSWTEAISALGVTIAPAEIEAAMGSLSEYIAGLIAQRRERPTADMISALVAARDEQDRLSEEELIALTWTLLVAGHETTANHLGNFMFTLLAEPDRWRRLVAAPDLLPGAIEELLRYVPISASVEFARIATADVEVGGQLVRAGEAVFADMPAANRDERVFVDAEEYVPTRADNPHLAFGHGPHFCLGSHLARLQLNEAIGTLLHRLPGLRLAVPADDVRWRTDRLIRGPLELPVSW